MQKSSDTQENEHSSSSQTNLGSKDWRSISVPFPPNVNPMDLVKPRKDGKPRKRCANYFLIYRIQFAEALRASGYTTPLMTDISMMAGDAWKEEPEFVRHYYKEVANEVKKLHDNLVRNAAESQSFNEITPLQVDTTPDSMQIMQMRQSYEIPHDITNLPGYACQQQNLINHDYSSYDNIFFQSLNELSLGFVLPESNDCYNVNDYFYKY